MRLFAILLASLIGAPVFACGPDTDCMIGDRHYRIAMPEGHDGASKVGAIVFAHGYRGTARGAMRNRNFRRMVSDMGLAFIAVKSASDDWVLPNSPRRKAVDGSLEFNYMDAVIEDASSRFALDTDRMMMTGFSAGGMMVWNMACSRPDLFAGYAPISGTFWLEPPDHCDGPVANLIHFHGDADPTVPLTGRAIADTHQGDVNDALSMYAKYGKFSAPKQRQVAGLSCSDRTNAQGDILNFCMFEGGHSFSRHYVSFAWQTLQDAGKF